MAGPRQGFDLRTMTNDYGLRIETQRSSMSRTTDIVAHLAAPTIGCRHAVSDAAIEDAVDPMAILDSILRRMSSELRGAHLIELLSHDIEPDTRGVAVADIRERIADRLASLVLRFCDSEMSERVALQLLERVEPVRGKP